MRLTDFSLKTKIILMIAQIGILSAVVLALAVWSMTSSQQRTVLLIEQSTALESLMSRISDDIHILLAQQKSYITSSDQDILNTANVVFQRLDGNLAELESVQQTIVPPATVFSFKAETTVFRNHLNELFKASREQGKVSTELTIKLSNARKELLAFYIKYRRDQARELFALYFAQATEHLLSHNDSALSLLLTDATAQKLSNVKGMAAPLVRNVLDTLKLIHENNLSYDKAYSNVRSSLEKATKVQDDVRTAIRLFKENEMRDLARLESYHRYGTIAFFASIILISIFSSSAIFRFSASLRPMIENLKQSSYTSHDASTELLQTTQKVSNTIRHQNASIAKAVALLNTVTNGVRRSAKNTEKSAEKANLSLAVSQDGKVAVNKMRQAMSEIQTSIDGITEQAESSNQRYASVLGIIQDITSKTQIINEIVFQTKLLSFNASVEAARAGEHGKGFAVVAAEVGNLANMSGLAAKGITDLLSRSKNDVEQIMKESRQQMETLVSDGNQKVEAGVELSSRCESVLEQVVANVSDVQTLMQTVASESKDEAQGISAVTAVMQQLAAMTLEHTAMAEAANAYSETLRLESKRLEETAQNLDVLVHGAHALTPSEHLTPRLRPSARIAVKPLQNTRSKPPARPHAPSKLQRSRQAVASAKKAKPGSRSDSEATDLAV